MQLLKKIEGNQNEDNRPVRKKMWTKEQTWGRSKQSAAM